MESMINCIIADDEHLAQQGLLRFAKEIPFLNVVGLCSDPLEVLAELARQRVDLLLLDIQMPKMSGIEFLKTTRNLPLTILTTAYPDYALQGYELDIVDYIVKPIAFTRFLKGVTKAKELLDLRQRPGMPANKEYFFVKCNNCLEKVVYSEILFVQAMRNYVVIYTRSKQYICYLTLKNIEEYLPQQKFIKVNKSNIIAIDQIERIAGNDIIIGEHEIAISKLNRQEVIHKVFSNSGIVRK